jgi:hypothetical protein
VTRSAASGYAGVLSERCQLASVRADHRDYVRRDSLTDSDLIALRGEGVTRHRDLGRPDTDEREANRSNRSADERGDRSGACHVVSVKCR